MNIVLPSTVEEINRLQQNFGMTSSKDLVGYDKGFENIQVEKRYKREVSLPDGLKNWGVDNIQSYLNFEEDSYLPKVVESAEDALVPEEGDSRLRCESFSSMTSTGMDDRSSMFFQGMELKTINTICMDSGSTCISAADHSYLNSTPDSIFRTIDPEETYQNLDAFLQQVPEVSENMPSPLSVSGSESSFDILQTGYYLQTSNQGSLSEGSRGTKRPASTSSEVDIFGLSTAKHPCPSPPPVRYNEVRRKNNIASKNCRKTRKEKQKEMEVRVSELEKEKEGLRVEVQVLEELIQAHKMQLYAILQRR